MRFSAAALLLAAAVEHASATFDDPFRLAVDLCSHARPEH